jgi:hypothetical protein
VDHWTGVIVKYWFIFAIALGVGIVVLAVRCVLRNRPRSRTSAKERLIARNPAIMFDDARWTTAARRVRTSRVTSFVVATAFLIVADRPVQRSAN